MDKKSIIYFSLDSWSTYVKRPHHFVRETSRLGIDTIYVEACPSLGRRTSFLLKNSFRRFSEAKKLDDHLMVLTIYLALPYHPLWFPGSLKNAIIHCNKLIWGMIVKKYMRKYCSNCTLFFINGLFTYPSNLLRNAREKRKNRITMTVYDCVDILEEFPNANKEITQYWERRAIQMSDAVFISAHNLADRKIMRNAISIYYVPNGVEFKRFQQSKKTFAMPHDIAPMKKQGHYLMGYVGALDEWIDFELMDKILAADPTIILCIIGKCISRRFTHKLEWWLRLLSSKYGDRFHYLGSKPYDEIPSYVNSFDLCLIPFKQSKLLAGINPIKLYEYFACGKGVISTYWQEIDEFGIILSFVRGDQDIVPAIHKEIKRLHDPTIRKKRLQIAESYDWHTVVTRALKAISAK